MATLRLAIPVPVLALHIFQSLTGRWHRQPACNLDGYSEGPRRSCRTPTVDRFDVEFKGDRAKLIWRVGVNAEKVVSETYDLIQILDPPEP